MCTLQQHEPQRANAYAMYSAQTGIVEVRVSLGESVDLSERAREYRGAMRARGYNERDALVFTTQNMTALVGRRQTQLMQQLHKHRVSHVPTIRDISFDWPGNNRCTVRIHTFRPERANEKLARWAAKFTLIVLLGSLDGIVHTPEPFSLHLDRPEPRPQVSPAPVPSVDAEPATSLAPVPATEVGAEAIATVDTEAGAEIDASSNDAGSVLHQARTFQELTKGTSAALP